jgi:hypothetical protein
MPKKLISIQDAADLSNKSVQTIRRAIKSKKLKHRRQKTPQGFNYMVNYESLCSIYGIKQIPNVKEEAPAKEENKIAKPQKATTKDDGFFVTTDDFKNLTSSLEKMVTQHSEERQNFIRLVDTLQEKIFVLENQLNLLQTPKKKWYQMWK